MKRMIPPIVALAVFMEAVDTTIINTAIPSMAHSLSVSVIDLKIALISYLLSLAIFIPISGWLADKFGTQKIFMSAILVFTLSSLACGFSTELYQLVLGRFLQGMGGAFMIPVGRLIIVRLFHRTELISAMNRVILPALIGPALGPLLGGIISETFTWRWIFWVNIPFGILNFILAYFWIENVKAQKTPPLDKMGFLLFGLGLAGLVFGFSALSESGISHQLTFLVFFISFILLTSYAIYSSRSTHPLLKIQLFLIRTFRISVIGNLFTRLGFGGIPFLLPLFLQIPLNFSPQSAGMMVAFTALGAMFIKFFSKLLVSTLGFKKLLLLNTIALGISLLLFIFIHQESSVLIIAIISLIFGVCASLQFSTMNPIAYSDISDEDIGSATSILSVNQQVSMSFGVAASALILKHFKIFSTNEPLLTLADFHHTFFVLGFITIIASSLFLFLKKDDGQNLIKEI